MNEANVMFVVQLVGQAVPLIARGLAELQMLLAEKDVDPAFYAHIEEAYNDRVAQAERERDSHAGDAANGSDPGNGVGG